MSKIRTSMLSEPENDAPHTFSIRSSGSATSCLSLSCFMLSYLFTLLFHSTHRMHSFLLTEITPTVWSLPSFSSCGIPFQTMGTFPSCKALFHFCLYYLVVTALDKGSGQLFFSEPCFHKSRAHSLSP